MEYLILIEGELRSLIRNTLERFIGTKFKKKRKKTIEIFIKVSIRVVSSLIAIQIFNKVKNITNFRKYSSFLFIGLFLYFFIDEMKNSSESN
tara:strand:- start:140 stop:415 length:276 start_codon:yes stop_codon:yes gene_type:complete